jgi:hypothetical protein
LLSLYLLNQEEGTFLSDLISLYGLPDAVTWTANPTSRIAFWFEEGIAATIFTGTRGNAGFGRVWDMIFLPYSSAANFETRWPYTATWQEPPNPDMVGDPIVTEQNPFNFDELIATVTEQPSRTLSLDYVPFTGAEDYAPFPTSLYCSDIQQVSAGPTWEGITIGVTSRPQFEAFISELNVDYDVVDGEDKLLFYAFNGRDALAQNVPTYITACFNGGTLVLVEISFHAESDSENIFDMVAHYGIPDAVTWTDTLGTRIAFWFEEGLAAEISVRQELESNYGKVIRVIYFLYQDSDTYEETWPYNRTPEQPVFGDSVVEPPLPEEQNPFDFDAIIATATAQPSSTPMP